MSIQLGVQVWKAGRMCRSTHQSMMVHWLDGGKTEIYVQQSMLNEDFTLGGRTKRSPNSSFHRRYVATCPPFFICSCLRYNFFPPIGSANKDCMSLCGIDTHNFASYAGTSRLSWLICRVAYHIRTSGHAA